MKQDELFPVFDQNNNFLKNVTRQELYSNDQSGNYYKIVHNIVYLPGDGPKKMWVQERLSSKYWGGYLVSAASGHVGVKADGLPESPEEAMYREVSEELFSDQPHIWEVQKLGDFDYRPDYSGYEGGTQQIYVFVSESEGLNFTPKLDEVGELHLMPVAELIKLAKDSNSLITPDFREIILRLLI